MSTPVRILQCPLLAILVACATAQGTGAVELADRARRGDATVVDELAALLADPDWRNRWHAARGIGQARAEWLDERLAVLLDDERVAPMAAYAIGQLIGRSASWPGLDRAQELVAAAKHWREQQQNGEGWVTHDVVLSPDLGTTVRGQMHAERGTAYLVVRDARADRETDRRPWSGPARAIAFSGDSSRFAASDDRGSVHVFATRGRALLRTLGGHAGWLWSVALSHDGTLLASSAQDGVLVVREVDSGAERWRRTGSEMVDLEFVTGAATLVGADAAGRLHVFSAAGEPATIAEDLAPVADLAVAADGKTVAVLHRGGELALFACEPRGVRWRMPAHSRGHGTVVFDAVGSAIATAGSDRRVRRWSVQDGALLGDFACERNVLTLRAAGALAGACYDGSNWRWEIASPR